MSVLCGLECVVCLGCTRWAWKRLTYIGSYDSETWPSATAGDFEPVPRVCRVVLAVYEEDLSRPRFAPPGGYGLNPCWVFKRVSYEQTAGRCPPYLIYVDRDHREIILAVRGLNLIRESDYKVLLDNRLGMQMFDGGYVHHGLLKAAIFMLKRESETLRQLLCELGSDYKLVLAGHSLGSGVAALMTIIVVNHRDRFGGIHRSKIRCYAIAPARCMSLNLAVKYADVINSVILQDDFLPRTPTPLEHIFGSIFCLPCLLFFVCVRDTFIPEGRKLNDPRRLYVPGRIYHIVERKFCRCGRFPPEVRTAIPVDDRFEHVVLSCNTTSDHALLWIEREAQKALDVNSHKTHRSKGGTVLDNQIIKKHGHFCISEHVVFLCPYVTTELSRCLYNIKQKMMKEREEPTIPPQQNKVRTQTLEKEHMNALERAVSLNVLHAISPPEDYSTAKLVDRESFEDKQELPSSSCGPKSGRANWDDLVEKLFARNESGNLVLKKEIIASEGQ